MEDTQIDWNDFKKINLRVGTIVTVKKFEKAIKKSYKIWADFGNLGIKKTSAQITANYDLKDLVGQQIIGVMNFPKKQIADFSSDFLLLAALNDDDENVVIIQPKSNVINGSKVS
jgi:tRNA-binding protein